MQMFPDDLPLANIDADGYCCHFMHSSVRPTIHGLGFVYCIQSAWKKWPTIWHADVSRWLTLSIQYTCGYGGYLLPLLAAHSSFSRSSVKFQGHTALKVVEFDPYWAFPDCNSSLNSPMVMKCCTKLETAKERCPIVFQGHPSNFKVTRDKTSLILTQIGRFRTIGQSQLSNPSDLPCFKL